MTNETKNPNSEAEVIKSALEINSIGPIPVELADEDAEVNEPGVANTCIGCEG